MKKGKKNALLQEACKMIFGTHTFRRESDFYQQFKENMYLTTEDGRKIGAFLYEGSPGPVSKIVLFLHGKGNERYMASEYLNMSELLRRYGGIRVLILDYRGFGDNCDKMSKSGFSLDILAAMAFLQNKYGTNDIIMVGHSFGCAFATEYMKHIDSHGLQKYSPMKTYLLAPFATIEEILHDYKAAMLFKDMFDEIWEFLLHEMNYDNVRNIRYCTNVKIYHGTGDLVVPFRHSRLIQQANSRVELVSLEDVGHASILSNASIWSDILLEK
ncbi:ABD12 [Enterospora canceri]|uniref:ABD12 n=1 Tax=Enterospora canceri TaxID=1081671 RepID=A0A1Y1S524_9MICR|nr:ABD12 [Enterospora canceri]